MIVERRLIKGIAIPSGVTVSIDGNMIAIKGKLGEVKRQLTDPTIRAEMKEGKIFLLPLKSTIRQKQLINTMCSHIRNMIKGVQEGFVYRMRVCSGHFPISIVIEEGKAVVKNLLGEKVPRVAKILPGVKVEVKGDIVTVTGANLELVSQTAANIELCAAIKDRDRRVFQDGIWIFEKDGKRVNA